MSVTDNDCGVDCDYCVFDGNCKVQDEDGDITGCDEGMWKTN